MTNEVLSIVEELNQEIFDKYGEDASQLLQFTVVSTGFYTSINFLGQVIWSSEEDDREWIEEENDYELLDPFIRKKVNELTTQISSLKF